MRRAVGGTTPIAAIRYGRRAQRGERAPGAGDQPEDDLLFGGSFAAATGTALDAVRAASIADASVPRSASDPGGLTAAGAADNATLGAYINVESVDPDSAVGLAFYIVAAALEFNLVAQLQAF